MRSPRCTPDANSACDHNQLTMEFLKKVADRHDLVCLLHEKPFAGVNGSGKHDNWSLATDTGENLLKPGRTPSQNAQFLLFLAAFIKGVDEYQEMLRCCVSYPGNDHRLGGNEAPPAIVSIFLGDELTAILRSIIDGTAYVDITKEAGDRRGHPAGAAAGYHRPQPHLPAGLYRQQVRVPDVGLSPVHRQPQCGAQHHHGRRAEAVCRPAGEGGELPSGPAGGAAGIPSGITSALSSTVTATTTTGYRRPSAGDSAICGTPWTVCPPTSTRRMWRCFPASAS